MKTAELRAITRELEFAVDHDDDDVALALIGRRDVLVGRGRARHRGARAS